MKTNKKVQISLASIGLILILALSRLMPHPDNFTPIIALAIMSSYFFRNVNFSYTVMLFSMLLADFFIGFYSYMLFVYVSLFLIVLIFFKISKKINYKNLFIFSFFINLKPVPKMVLSSKLIKSLNSFCVNNSKLI